ncbi:MAG: L-lactate permease [Gammaproteobacteria bacterium]|nr:L-lactate permease [Gammaproteobacteria bacterium]
MNGILISALPLIVLMAALLLKRGAVASPIAGGAAVLAVVFHDARFALDTGALLSADLPVVLILTLSVALVVVPGQMLNALLQASGVIAAIGARIETIPLSRMKMASMIVLGVAPALESMTGFGVSLFFTVPVLVQLFSMNKALLLSLLSMNIMPWGTLALATQVGAQLSGTPFSQLAFTTSLTSFAVFPVIGLLIFAVCREPGDQWRVLAWPLLAGLLLSCCLVFYNTHAAAELAGVYAGLTTAALMLLAEFLRRGPGLLSAFLSARPALLRLFAPYLTLIALIGLSRVAPVHDALQNLPGFQSGNVKLFVFASPGVFIFLTILLMCACSGTWRNHSGALRDGIRRAVYPVTATMLFLVFAQLHRASGIFEDLASRMVALSVQEMTFIAPLLGMLSGYATGSNIGGNALFMALQSDTGRHFEHAVAFAALQNSSAGHAVFLSLPVVLLALSIAAGSGRGDGRGGSGDDVRARQAWLIRRALLCAPLIYGALVVGFWGVVG